MPSTHLGMLAPLSVYGKYTIAEHSGWRGRKRATWVSTLVFLNMRAGFCVLDLEKVVSLQVDTNGRDAVLHVVSVVTVVSQHPTWTKWQAKLINLAKGH